MPRPLRKARRRSCCGATRRRPRRPEGAGLGVNAGHDLNLDNLPAFCQALPQLAEVSIGHAITADALRIGFPAAVEAYLRAIKRVSLAA